MTGLLNIEEKSRKEGRATAQIAEQQGVS